MKSQVSIVRDVNIEERTRQAAELVGGLEKVVGKGDRVLIKPNMVGGFPSETDETTDPAVVEMAFEAGAKEVVVGESEPVQSPEALRRRFVNRPIPNVEALHIRYEKAFRKLGAKLIDFNVDGWRTVQVPDPVFFDKVQVARALLDCDVFIGVPALKTHHLAGITVALKNLYGAIPRSDKRKYHQMDKIEEVIVDLNLVRTSDMVIVDGTRTILHWGRVDQYLETHEMDLTIAGFDPVADRGDMMTSVEYMNKRLRHVHLMNCGACTGCFGRIATALNRIDDSNVKEDIFIVMGPNARLQKQKGKVFLCGNCAAPTFYNRLKGTYIPGCPPDLKPLVAGLERLGATI